VKKKRRMIRRDLLRLLVAMVTGGQATGTGMAQTGEQVSSTDKRVLVIGAGLAAARQLRDLGHDVLVVEARDRIGGRVWTSDKWADMPVDLGASWIHGIEDNPLTDLAGSIDAELIMTSYDRSRLYRSDGDELSDDEEEQLERLWKQLERALRAAQDADEDVTVQRVLDELAIKLKATPELGQFFAGEATEVDHFATAHGAGLRAAKEIKTANGRLSR
jgi:monoamine oxidase